MSTSLTPQVTLQGATPIPPSVRAATVRLLGPRQLALGDHLTVKAALAANYRRIASYLGILLAVNIVCGIERLHFYLAAHHPGVFATWIGDAVHILQSLFQPISFTFETFVFWFCTDLMDLGTQNLFDWRHGMLCFLFTVPISVAFFAIGSVIVDRLPKHGEGK